jgi:hypothetical protein
MYRWLVSADHDLVPTLLVGHTKLKSCVDARGEWAKACSSSPIFAAV